MGKLVSSLSLPFSIANFPEAVSTGFIEKLNLSEKYGAEAHVVAHYDDLLQAIREYIVEYDYELCHEALEILLKNRKGQFRDDGETPLALHQLTQFIWVISLIESGLPIEKPEFALALALLHDEGEDSGLTPDVLLENLCSKLNQDRYDQESVQDFCMSFDRISKKFGDKRAGRKGEKRHESEWQYYLDISLDTEAALVKLTDNCQNLMTLVGAKKFEKLKQYLVDRHTILNDFVTMCCRQNASQARTYRALQHVAEKLIKICEYAVTTTGKPLPNDKDIAANMPRSGFKNIPRGLHPLFVCADRIRNGYDPKQIWTSEPERSQPQLSFVFPSEPG